MSDELDILKIVAGCPEISQRKIAEQTGISLGQVNFLIKKCVRKGLIKIEGQTAKSIKYNLTPNGIAEKAALTMEYIKISYGAVIALTDKIRAHAKQYEMDGRKIYVYGAEDEMMEICKLALEDRAEYICIPSKRDRIKTGSVCLFWESREPNDIIDEKSDGIIWVNILN
ncbi:MAG TPA: winged helix-turn-helix transcriptional regulator [Anaerovoracaceae bacterium]|nr:winged helix-turn-helix transcriptional regulator [Anaerovoracaceae bacterium]